MFFLFVLLFLPLFGNEIDSTRHFLEQVEAVSAAPSQNKTKAETELYREGINFLLTQESLPHVYMEKIKQELMLNSGMDRLRFFLALSAKEGGDESEFQRQFLKAYASYPSDYLSYRIKGGLYASLYAHVRSVREKNLVRQATFQNVSEALASEPRDREMQKLKIAFCQDEERCQTIGKIIDKVGKVPKEDVRYFVVQLVDTGEKKKAEAFLDKAREWYSGSRVINRSQNYIDKH